MIKCDMGAVNPAFCTFDGPDGFRQYLPEDKQHHPEAYWRAKAGRGEFASYMKLSYRGVAFFKKSHVLQHFILLFGELRPDCVVRLRAAGYVTEKLESVGKKPKTRKASNTQRKEAKQRVNDLLKPKRLDSKKGRADAL